MAYWIFRYLVIGPLLGLVFRIKVVGLENVPQTGGVIFAANHQAVVDSFIIPAVIDRKFTFIAKSDYFTESGVLGWLKKKFFSIGAVPVDRDDRGAGTRAAEMLVDIVSSGGAIGIHPEGTRAPDSHVYRGKRGVIDIAWRTGAPVVPIALLGTRDANPPGVIWPRFGSTIVVSIGKPMYFVAPHHTIPAFDRAQAILSQRSQTRKLMERIAELAGWHYVDIDARKAKEALLN